MIVLSRRMSAFHQNEHSSGGRTVNHAAFALHLEHFSRGLLALRLPAPQASTISAPVSVLDDPQLPHSIFTLAPGRTSSAAVSMCLVDILAARGGRNESGQAVLVVS